MTVQYINMTMSVFLLNENEGLIFSHYLYYSVSQITKVFI